LRGKHPSGARGRTRRRNGGPPEGARRLVQRLIIPRESGKAFVVPKGHVLRVIAIDGQQVCDFNAFNLKNPEEAFWAGGTRSLEGTHLTVGGQLWSKPPWIRVMFTILADTVKQRPSRRGFRSHDLLFSRCNSRLYAKRGMPGHANCHDNLARGIRRFKLSESAVHDAFNIFMKTCALPNGTQVYTDPDAKKGDYMDLRAEMDCLVSLSACPGRSSGPRTRRLAVEIYDA
jgi:uncharacterized protein YcgI (DUF1989 family)